MSNPKIGRHSLGAPIAKSGTRPPSRTGSPSGYFVGTGVNRKTAARPEQSPSRTPTNVTSGNQLNAITKQAPEPFRNPARRASPQLGGVSSDKRQGYSNPKGRAVMTQAEINLATGHKANYRPAGYNYNAANSGRTTEFSRRAGSSHDAIKPGRQSRGR
jgi:hypothetical protein